MLEKLEIIRLIGMSPNSIKVSVKKGKLVYDRIDSENTFFLFDKKSSLDPEEFSKGLEQFHIENWKDDYENNNVFDGEEWTVIYKKKGEKKIEKGGSNAWPACWSKFLKYVESVVDEEMEEM